MRRALPLLLALAIAPLAACQTSTEDAEAGEDAITSREARIVDFTFEGEVVAKKRVETRTAVVSQLMYVQGILTSVGNGNGHIGNVVLTNVTESREGSKKRIRYKASLPVAWPRGRALPDSYDLPLPKDTTALDAFNAKYDGRCGRNEYGQETFWHDFNPQYPNCTIDDADVSRSRATVTPHSGQTAPKYPEYDEIWKDDRLDVVAIFGIITSNTPNDLGYTEARGFVDHTRSLLSDPVVRDNRSSASILKDQTVTGRVRVGGRDREVKIDVLVVQELAAVKQDFARRYDPLSEKADMILYNGHAGLGKNINALAEMGKVAPDKYQLVLLNGCQSFAYLDTSLTDRRRDANGAARDPNGTRFLDVIGNALPGYADNLANMSNTLVDAAVRSDAPRSYDALLADMPPQHIVVVFGEDDNRFTP